MNTGMLKPGRHQARRHVIHRLYANENDFNCFGGEPVGTYMLATLPRSGSTYCAIKLWQTGLLGAPMEYLNFRILGRLFQRLGYKQDEHGFIAPEKVQTYWRNIQRLRTSKNGVFGYKMFTNNYAEIAEKYPEFLGSINPNYVIYLTRSDEIGQAISYSRAQRSRIWFAGIGSNDELTYDYNHLRYSYLSIKRQKDSWESAFKLTGVSPTRITYEQLLDNEARTVESILEFMGITPDSSAQVKVPLIERQTDGVSREWRDRFLEDMHRDDALETSRQ